MNSTCAESTFPPLAVPPESGKSDPQWPQKRSFSADRPVGRCLTCGHHGAGLARWLTQLRMTVPNRTLAAKPQLPIEPFSCPWDAPLSFGHPLRTPVGVREPRYDSLDRFYMFIIADNARDCAPVPSLASLSTMYFPTFS